MANCAECKVAKISVEELFLIVYKGVFHLVLVFPFTECVVISTTVVIRITAWNVDCADIIVTYAPYSIGRKADLL